MKNIRWTDIVLAAFTSIIFLPYWIQSCKSKRDYKHPDQAEWNRQDSVLNSIGAVKKWKLDSMQIINIAIDAMPDRLRNDPFILKLYERNLDSSLEVLQRYTDRKLEYLMYMKSTLK